MKATGIIRRIDDLGRVVIPIAIRRTTRIREGDPLEIFIDDDAIIFRKYPMLTPIKDLIFPYVSILSLQLHCPIVITDTDQIIAKNSESPIKASIIETLIEEAIKRRQTITKKNTAVAQILFSHNRDHSEINLFSYITPIFFNGEIIGTISAHVANTDFHLETQIISTIEVIAKAIALQLDN